ncbi:MAG TPA: SPOR domain-containing protein [Luteimonas sp.]|nr:SPOR domain-containing protein [Luteimonas sp.]
MAARRGKSQARRNTGNSAGMPGWAWLVLGVVLTIAVVLAAPKFMKSGDGDGFFRPTPNPDAKPAATSTADDDGIADGDTASAKPAAAAKPKPTQYDFYTMLPGDEVQMSDAELAATEREEAARKAKATPASPAATPADATPAADAQPGTTTPGTTTASPTARAAADAPYLLQAGAFGASGDAEATKAKVALLGLGARVESATINGKTVYRVRMGPYTTASELAEAKRKLADGGLPAMAIKVKP